MLGIKTRRRPGRESRAAVAVEFALLLPVWLTIVLGCVDFGRFARSFVAVTNACGEAATFASMHAPSEFPDGVDGWVAAIRQQAVDEAPTIYPAIDPANVSVDLDVLEEGFVSVRVEYTFATLVPWPGIPTEVPIRRLAAAPQMP